MADSSFSELNQLRRENPRLIGLLEAHGIAWRSGEPIPTEPAPMAKATPANDPSSTQEKVSGDSESWSGATRKLVHPVERARQKEAPARTISSTFQ
jgi:hypothetical protein